MWRAAFGIPDTDPRPTGPALRGGAASHQHPLDHEVRQALDRPRATTVEWSQHLPPAVQRDPRSAALRTRLTALLSSGADVPNLIETALAEKRPLPVENPADALGDAFSAPRQKRAPPVPRGRDASACPRRACQLRR